MNKCSDNVVVDGGSGGLAVNSKVGLFLGGISEQVLRDYFSPQSVVTERAARLALRRMAAELGMLPESQRIEDVHWHLVTAAHFSELMYIWRETLGAVSVRRYLSILRGLSRMCFLNNMMSGDAYARIKEVRLPKGANVAGRGMRVERQHQKKLIDSCLADDRVHGVRDAAILAVLFGTGIRRAEAASLKSSDINLVAGEIKVSVKGGNSVVRFLSAWAVPYIKAWIDTRAMLGMTTGYLFVGINRGGRLSDKPLSGEGLMYIFKQRSMKAGLPFVVRPHDARRTMGTEMIEEHGELIAQRVLGHASLDTTRIYDKRTDDVLRNIMTDRK